MRAVLGGGRVGLATLCVLAGAVMAPTTGHGRCDTSIRVLVARGADPIRLELDGQRRRLEAAEAGLRLDGGPVRADWRSGPVASASVGGLRVTGSLRAFRDGRDLVVVNHVPLERYVAGTIGGEMPASWAREALRAQAVASRSYGLYQQGRHRSRGWDVAADTRSQVYRGLDAHAPARRAAKDTRCEVLSHRGSPILAAFHSASGGQTASAGEIWGRDVAYLRSLAVSDDEDSPDTYWRIVLSQSTLGRSLGAAGLRLGEVTEARIEGRSPSGRVAWIRFRGSDGEGRLSGRRLRQLLGERTLPSTLFDVRVTEDGFAFVGSGRGHGVGMSQWAAQGLAEQGATYREILEKFYPGTTLGTWESGRTAAVRSDRP